MRLPMTPRPIKPNFAKESSVTIFRIAEAGMLCTAIIEGVDEIQILQQRRNCVGAEFNLTSFPMCRKIFAAAEGTEVTGQKEAF